MAEFVSEVRKDSHTHLLFMPQYQHHLTLRMVRTVLDVIHDYPVHPLGRGWDDRVFHPDETGKMRPLSALWREPPRFIETVFSALRLVEARTARRFPGFAPRHPFHAQGLALHPERESV